MIVHTVLTRAAAGGECESSCAAAARGRLRARCFFARHVNLVMSDRMCRDEL